MRTIDNSNPSHSALNLIDIYVDKVQVKYNNLLDFQIIELLDKIKAVEDIELTGKNSNLENCNNDLGEPSNNRYPVDNYPEQPDEEPLEVVLYAD